jgi:NDP-sugar pyrophosphorylase family protein
MVGEDCKIRHGYGEKNCVMVGEDCTIRHGYEEKDCVMVGEGCTIKHISAYIYIYIYIQRKGRDYTMADQRDIALRQERIGPHLVQPYANTCL